MYVVNGPFVIMIVASSGLSSDMMLEDIIADSTAETVCMLLKT